MLKRILFRSGVSRENTRYASESLGGGGNIQVANATAGWYDCDKVRFRSGTPEKIGGWVRRSNKTFLGICRSLWNWISLGGDNLIGVGTNLKFYISLGGNYFDITPIRDTETLVDPFTTTSGSAIVEVEDAAGGYLDGDFVTFSGATAVGGLTLNGEYQISYSVGTSYTITASSNATSSATGGGTVTATYQINTGPAFQSPLTGWGAGAWGLGVWGVCTSTADPIRLWSQSNFGEDLIFCPRGGGLYYWDASAGVTNNRGENIADDIASTDCPTKVNSVLVSDASRFVFAFGCTDIGQSTLDPLLIRWSDQEDYLNWTPSATTQAGSLRLSLGSTIVTSLQSRQEVLIWTDAALYSLQFQGAPIVWGSQIVGDNISIAGPNAAAIASGVTYWMGLDKFYKYDGRTQTLRCDLRQYIFDDINQLQMQQVCSGTNEGFNEVWWFYCSANSVQINRYVIYNYAEDIWYYGEMGRTAWLDSGLQSGPIAATYANNLVNHEIGNDDGIGDALVPIAAYISSAEFDLDDGHNFSFVWRVLPDITFRGSTSGATPSVTMTLLPLKNSGSGITNPASVGGSNSAGITRTAVLPIEEFTGQVFTRVRGRQLAMRVDSTGLGVAWQMGAFRLDVRLDGRR
jgi:hypothetical protein